MTCGRMHSARSWERPRERTDRQTEREREREREREKREREREIKREKADTYPLKASPGGRQIANMPLHHASPAQHSAARGLHGLHLL